MVNCVTYMHDAIWKRPRGNQLERNTPMARSDERNAFTDHDRNDMDREFVDSTGVQK